MPSANKRSTVVYLPDELWIDLKMLAVRRRSNVSREIQAAVEAYLAALDDGQTRMSSGE